MGILAWLRGLHSLLPGYLKPLIGFSIAINLLLLVAPIYMLQVYDRVLASGSHDTLIWLTLIAVFLLSIYAAAESGRRRLSSLAAEAADQMLSERIFRRFEAQPAGGAALPSDLADLGRVRGVFQSTQLLPLFDLPFAPLFLGVLFLLHPVIGLMGLAGVVLVFAIAFLAEWAARHTNLAAAGVTQQADDLAGGLARQRSAMVAMGLVGSSLTKWQAIKDKARALNLKAGGREGAFSATARAVRQILQILILGVGAALALAQEISPGAIVAGSILLSRALAPVDQIVGSWRSLVQARAAWQRLASATEEFRQVRKSAALPKPKAQLAIARMAIAAPGGGAPLVRPFSLTLEGGQSACIAGANGVGKSTLLQTLAGVWPAAAGAVTLGGRSLHRWPSADRGKHVGYVPQDVELLPGTIAENIARMQDAPPEEIYAAAKRAGAHETILSLPDGYDTVLGMTAGRILSAGQRQMIGLARALFRDPVLLLLDEPTANLDPAAARAVIGTLKAAAERGAIVIAVSHDAKLIASVQTVLVIQNGAILSAQPETFLKAAGAPAAPAPAQLRASVRGEASA